MTSSWKAKIIFRQPLGDEGDTTVSAEMTLPLLEKTLTLHPFRN